ADSSLNFFDWNHLDSVPGAPIEERAIRALADALLTTDAQRRIHLDAAKGSMIFIRNPVHAIRYRTIRHACRRARATAAALGNDRKLLGLFLARGGDPFRFGLHLDHSGGHDRIMPYRPSELLPLFRLRRYGRWLATRVRARPDYANSPLAPLPSAPVPPDASA